MTIFVISLILIYSGVTHAERSSSAAQCSTVLTGTTDAVWLTGVPNGYWKSEPNRLKYLEWLGAKLGFSEPEDWYGLTQKAFAQNKGSTVLGNYYSHSPYKMLNSLKPELKLKPWLFGKTNSSFWNDVENIREYLAWLGERLGYEILDDWYQVKKSDFTKNSGGGLVDRLSTKEVLSAAYPEHNWVPWKFGQVGHGYWHVKENRMAYLEWLGNRLGLNTPEDWTTISNKTFQDNFGGGILDYYGNAFTLAVNELYPNLEIPRWAFSSRVALGYWDNMDHQAAYMRWLGRRLGYKSPEDWYQLKSQDVINNFGGQLIGRYDGSPTKLVQALIPEYDFLPWLQTYSPDRLWEDWSMRRAYMDWLGEQLGVQSMDDWYNVGIKDFHAQYGGNLLGRIYGGSPSKMIMDIYPEFDWQVEKFDKKNLKSQQRVLELVKQLYPGEQTLWNYRGDEFRFPESGRKMEIDIYLPNLKLAIEYNGAQHYRAIDFFGGEKTLGEIQERDQAKRERLEASGIRLVEVPYTWDRTSGSLAELIKAVN